MGIIKKEWKHKCIDCNKNVQRKETKRCIVCHKIKGQKGSNNHHWKGGIKMTPKGYIMIYKPNNPSSLVNGYMLEHRYIMEKSLNRFLKDDEVVHHINGIKSDNRIENLKIMSNSEHMSFHNKGEKNGMSKKNKKRREFRE